MCERERDLTTLERAVIDSLQTLIKDAGDAAVTAGCETVIDSILSAEEPIDYLGMLRLVDGIDVREAVTKAINGGASESGEPVLTAVFRDSSLREALVNIPQEEAKRERRYRDREAFGRPVYEVAQDLIELANVYGGHSAIAGKLNRDIYLTEPAVARFYSIIGYAAAIYDQDHELALDFVADFIVVLDSLCHDVGKQRTMEARDGKLIKTVGCKLLLRDDGTRFGFNFRLFFPVAFQSYQERYSIELQRLQKQFPDEPAGALHCDAERNAFEGLGIVNEVNGRELIERSYYADEDDRKRIGYCY